MVANPTATSSARPTARWSATPPSSARCSRSQNATGYATRPPRWSSFNVDVGAFPEGGLIADANGTFRHNRRRWSHRRNSGDWHSVRDQEDRRRLRQHADRIGDFDGSDGVFPMAGLTVDANGDLFGTTYIGGADNLGTVFEIKKTAAGYASTPTVLANFNGTNGDTPWSSSSPTPTATSSAQLRRAVPARRIGTVFEIIDSGFATTALGPDSQQRHPVGRTRAPARPRSGKWTGTPVIGGGPSAPIRGRAWTAVGTGDFNGDGHSDILWQNATTGQASIWEMNGNTRIGGGPVTPNPGPDLESGRNGRFQ